MTEKLSEQVNRLLALQAEVSDRIKAGINSIDRILWTIGDDPYMDRVYDDEKWPVPEKFTMTSYWIKDSTVYISWAIYFRGETDDYGTFEIPEIYFNDKDAYKRALVYYKTKQALVEAEEAANKEQQEAEAAERRRIEQAELLETLLAKRERGEI